MTICCVESNVANAANPGRAVLQWPGRVLDQLHDWWQRRQRRYIDRRAIVHLQKLDDATLRDIGLHRGDISWASHLPKSADVSAELELLARGHRVRRDLSVHQ